MLGASEKYALVVKTPKQLAWVFGELDKATEFAYDIETTHATANETEYHIPAVEAKILGISFSWAVNRAAYIPLFKDGLGTPYFKDPVTHNLVVSKLKKILEKRGVKKIGQNFKFDNTYLYYNLRIEVQDSEFDTMVAHWIIDENGEHENWAGVRIGTNHGLEKISTQLLGSDASCGIEYDRLQEEVAFRDPKFKRYETVPIDIVGRYACLDAIDTYKVYLRESKMIEAAGQSDFFLNHEMAKTYLLTKAEIEGLPIYTDKIPEVIAYLDVKMLEIREQLKTDIGFDFDPAHTENTAHVLFETLKLDPIGGKGKTGQFATNKKVLEKLARVDDKNPEQPLEVRVPRQIIAYRNLSRMKTNYAEAVYRYIDHKKKIFHMSYRQIGTDTGRLSAAIIQSMPSEKKGGKIVKGLFWAGDGNVLVFNDLSQIELRVMAELSGDESMITAFERGEDIHTATAKRLLGVTDEWIKDPANKAEFAEVRRRAKTINFGVLFGEGPAKISEDLNFEAQIIKEYESQGKTITKEMARKAGIDRAKGLIESYFEAFPGVKALIDRVHREAELTGQVRNMFGRVRHLDDIVHLAAINMPRYKDMMLTQEQQNLYYGRQAGVEKPPSCYLGHEEEVFPPTLSGHLGFDMESTVAGRKPPTTEAVRARLVASSHGRVFSRCVTCPYLGPCSWEGEQSRRRMKLQRMRRQAFSSLIQSTAVDMDMYSWRNIDMRIRQEKIPCHGTSNGLALIVLQVHDELGGRVAASHGEYLAQVMQEELERWPNEDFPNWRTPIKADASPPVVSWDLQEK